MVEGDRFVKQRLFVRWNSKSVGSISKMSLLHGEREQTSNQIANRQ